MIKQLKRIGFVIVCMLSIPIMICLLSLWGVSSSLILIGGCICGTIEYIISGNSNIVDNNFKFVMYDFPMFISTNFDKCMNLFYPEDDNDDNPNINV